MPASTRRRPSIPILLTVLLLLPALGHAESETVPAAPAATWIRAEEVPTRAGMLLRQLEGARPDPTGVAAIARIERDLAQLEPDLVADLRQASTAAARSTPFVELEDIRRQVVADAAPLGPWEETLAAEAKRVLAILDEIAQARRLWLETRDHAEIAAAGDVVVRRVQASLDALDEVATDLRAWRASVLTLDDRIVDRRAKVAAVLEQLRVATINERTHILVPGRAPIWQSGVAERLRSELPRVPEAVRAYARSTYAYVGRDARPIVVQALLALVLMAVFRRLAAPTERPYAVAALLVLLGTPVFHPLAPQRFMQLVGVLALVPAARIVVHHSGRATLPGFAALLILVLVDRLTLAVAPLPTVARVSVLVSLVIAMGLARWVARRARATEDPWLHRASRVALVGLVVAFLAEIGGWANLSTLLGRGVLSSATLAVYVYAAVIGVEPVLVHLLTSPMLSRSHLLQRRTAVLRDRVGRTLRWLGAGLWLYLVVRSVGLSSAALEATRAFLGAGITVGALSLSIGNVLAFVLTLMAAMFLARVVHGVLEEDVYPRASLPRGIPYVLSTLAQYGICTLGFLLALAAAGVHLGQLTILLGGLGVGVGLGLQDLVKNFAAGLTLLIERRVHVGDSVQIPSQAVTGRVHAIGLRATILRSGNGSEILVPNADLVSSSITNWTLSDRLCRIEVTVGVAHGSDPDRVVALLAEVPQSIDGLLAHPEPQALFKGFGESALDFVVSGWTDRGYEQAGALTSELALAVHRALQHAGIVIPFPQRALHLASVSSEARATLFPSEKE